MIILIRVSYGSKQTPLDKREYQKNGRGPVGTLTEWHSFYPTEKFEIHERTEKQEEQK
jgi:hypothetical protein